MGSKPQWRGEEGPGIPQAMRKQQRLLNRLFQEGFFFFGWRRMSPSHLSLYPQCWKRHRGLTGSQQMPEHGGLLKRKRPRRRLGGYVFTPRRAQCSQAAASLDSGERDGAGLHGGVRGSGDSGVWDRSPAERRGVRREPEHPLAALHQTPSWAWARLAACHQNIIDELD